MRILISVILCFVCQLPGSDQSLMDTLMTPITWMMQAATPTPTDLTTVKSISEALVDEIDSIPGTQSSEALLPTTMLPPTISPIETTSPYPITSSSLPTKLVSLASSPPTTTKLPTTTSTTTTTTPSTPILINHDPGLNLVKMLANLTSTSLVTRTGRQEGYDEEDEPQPVYNPADSDQETEKDEYRPHFQFHSELAKALGVLHDNRKVVPNRL